MSKKKNDFLNKIKNKLIFHYKNCSYFKNFIKNEKIKIQKLNNLEKIPFLHINLFKKLELLSCKKKKVVMQLNSSGTSGVNSKIFLDKHNSINQKKILNKILTKEFGKERLPLLIVDKNPKYLNDRRKFSASLAAILGFSLIGKDNTYVLNKDGKIDYKSFNSFLKKYSNQKFLIFGFTYKIYECFIANLKFSKLNESLSNSILIHGGGWKKLAKLGIENNEFKKILNKKLNINKVINYYGFVEQTGSIFLECPEKGFFHTNEFTDIFVRNKNLKLTKKKEVGILQSISLAPSSYPGNSLILEDEAIFYGDSCICGRNGKIFKINGRIKQAEVRGCSDAI